MYSSINQGARKAITRRIFCVHGLGKQKMKFVGAFLICGILLGCTAIRADVPFDRPGLLAHVPTANQQDVRGADRHILVVRHARKVSPDCNALNCPLSPQGEAMVARLHQIIGEPSVDLAFASAACRTMLTAAAGGGAVTAHQAANGYITGCIGSEKITRQRKDALADARVTDARWTIVGEHSNTVCTWLLSFTDKATTKEAGCTDGRLPGTAYGDVFWLYRTQGQWKLVVLHEVF